MNAQAAAPPAATGGRLLPAVPVLEAPGIEKSYRRGTWPAGRRRLVLRGVGLALYPGEVAGLAGENGSGKSTLPFRVLVDDRAAVRARGPAR